MKKYKEYYCESCRKVTVQKKCSNEILRDTSVLENILAFIPKLLDKASATYWLKCMECGKNNY